LRQLGRPSRRSAGVCLQAVEIVDGALRMARRREDRSIVVVQHLQPFRHVRGVVITRFKREVEVGTQKGRTEFGHEFFDGLAFGPEAPGTEVAGEARCVTDPVRRSVRTRRVVALRIPERLERWAHDAVRRGPVEGTAAAVIHGRPRGGEERLGTFDAGDRIKARSDGRCVERRGQSVDLFDVEHGVALEEMDRVLDLVAGAGVGGGPDPRVRICISRVQRDGTVAIIDKDSRFMQYGDLVDVTDLVTILIAIWFAAEHVVDALPVRA
jgi:hypothetical protein